MISLLLLSIIFINYLVCFRGTSGSHCSFHPIHSSMEFVLMRDLAYLPLFLTKKNLCTVLLGACDPFCVTYKLLVSVLFYLLVATVKLIQLIKSLWCSQRKTWFVFILGRVQFLFVFTISVISHCFLYPLILFSSCLNCVEFCWGFRKKASSPKSLLTSSLA